MVETLKEMVYEANILLPKYNLVTFTWGNVSGIDREKGLVVIKPSGVSYEDLSPNKMVALDLKGKVVEGDLNPSSDTPTHLYLYNNFKNIKGIVHTHSRWATSFAQAGTALDAYGTTHGDYFYGQIPCTKDMTRDMIKEEYEKNTGKIIVETFKNKNINEDYVPGVLVKSHGPFTWGKDPFEAVHNSVVLEEIAMMAINSKILNPDLKPMSQDLLDKHFLRKHGKNAYYGQNK